VFLGDDSLANVGIEGSGLVRVRGLTTIGGLALSGSTLFVDLSSIVQDGGNLTLDDTVTARNLAGATWDMENGANITTASLAGSSQFVNLGLLEQTGFASTINANFYDRGGTIEVNGTLDFSLDTTFGYTVFANRFVDDVIEGSGTLELSGGTRSHGPVSVGVTDAYDVLVGSTITVATAELSQVRIVGNVTISSATVDGGIINLGAGSVLSITNPDANVNFRQETGAGTIDIKGDSINVAPYQILVGDVTFANYGNMKLEVGLETKSWTDDTVTIENETGATWTDVAFLATSGFGETSVTGSSVFINDGTFVEDTTGGATFGMPVVNNGMMETGASVTSSSTSSPNFVFSDALSGTGTVDIGADNVILDDVVPRGQTFNFNAVPSDFGTPTLILNDPQDFAATISGFDLGTGPEDKIVFNSTTWRFQDFVSGGFGGALMLTNGTETTAIHLAGDYNPLGFSAAVSGSTTTITYSG
jgi:hypothetical protein